MKERIRLFALAVTLQAALFAADPFGIWMGQAPGRNDEKQDIALRLKIVQGKLTGTMFGEEFDIPFEDLKIDGETISFAVTTTNYYSGTRQTTRYTGTVSDREMQLTRERKDTPATPPVADRKAANQTFTLKRVTP